MPRSSIADYAAQIPEPADTAPKFAIVRGSGAVILGRGDVDPFGNEGNLGSETIGNAISEAIDDRVRRSSSASIRPAAPMSPPTRSGAR